MSDWSRHNGLRFLKPAALYADYKCFFRHSEWRAELSADYPPGTAVLLYHCWWSGRLTRHHLLSLRSLEVTQHDPYQVWLWMSPADIDANEGFVRGMGLPHVQVRPYDAECMAAGTDVEGRDSMLGNRHVIYMSDLFRTLVLSKYGGIYFDLDVVFLRDLRPLCGVDFIYQWSNRRYGNSAVMHFTAGSPNAAALLERACEIGTCHPTKLYRFAVLDWLLTGVYVLPSFVFDPVWIAHDTGISINGYCNTFDQFFERGTDITVVTMREFFTGSYAYHWHNRWTKPLTQGSIAGQLCDELGSGAYSLDRTDIGT